MSENIGALIIGVAFLCIAIFDLMGVKVHIIKQYRKKNGVHLWQRKRFFADILVSLGAWIIFIGNRENLLFFVIGCTVTAIGFVSLVYLDVKFKKQT